MAFSISSKVVTKGRQENRKMTAREAANCFKLELPVESYKWPLEMDAKTEGFIQGIYETKI